MRATPPERRHLLAAPQVGGAQVLPAVVQRVEVEAVGVAVAVAGVAAVPLVERPRRRRGRGSRPAAPARASSGPPRGIVRDQPGRLGVDDLHGVGRGSWRRRGSCRRGRRPARSAARPAATRRNRPSSLSSSAGSGRASRSAARAGGVWSVRKIMTSCVPPQLDGEELAVAARRPRRGRRPRPCPGGRARAWRTRSEPSSVDPRQPLAEHPAEVDVVARSWRTRGSSCWRRSRSCRRR